MQDTAKDKPLLIHRLKTFDRSLEELRHKAGSGEIAASKAEQLIRQLSGSNDINLRRQFRFTRSGENRITYCRKYDLGCGYRLVFIRKGEQIAFLYVGTHDDCFRWISRNRGFTYEFVDSMNNPEPPRPEAETNHFSDEHQYLETDEYEDQLMRKIDDKILRVVFAGLTTQS